MHTAFHSHLDALANRPVLTVHQIPELHSIGGVEVGPDHFRWMKQETTDNLGPVRRFRPQQKYSGMMAARAAHQVGIEQFTLVADFLIFIQSGKRLPGRRSRSSKRICAFAVRNAALPVQAEAPSALEVGHDLAEFRMNAAAVVALVVVFENQLPVGSDIVKLLKRRALAPEGIKCSARKHL